MDKKLLSGLLGTVLLLIALGIFAASVINLYQAFQIKKLERQMVKVIQQVEWLTNQSIKKDNK